jgi:uncharacterized protein YidB (DUF937 family)
MFDKLINLIRGNADSAIINNNAIPNEKNDQAVQTAGTSIMSTLQNALSTGRLKDVLSFFKGGGSESDEIVKEATNKYAQDLKSDVGLSDTEAQNTAAKIIPQTMNQLAAKTADPSDNSFNIQDIFNKLSGGKIGSMDIQGMLTRFKGGKLDRDGDGDVDFQD